MPGERWHLGQRAGERAIRHAAETQTIRRAATIRSRATDCAHCSLPTASDAPTLQRSRMRPFERMAPRLAMLLLALMGLVVATQAQSNTTNTPTAMSSQSKVSKRNRGERADHVQRQACVRARLCAHSLLPRSPSLSAFALRLFAKVSNLFVSLFANPLSPYDAQLRPGVNTSVPVTIQTALRINLLFNVDSKEETFQLDLFVNEYWIDERLRFDGSEYESNNALRIPSKFTPWLPDTFFFNAIKCLPIQDSSLTLSADGTVFWSRHQSCTFHSPFNLQNFPFDEQILAVRRTSFSYTDDELLLRFLTVTGWRPDPQTDFTNSLWDFQYAFSNHTSLVFINTHSANAYLSVARRSTSYILKMILPLLLLVLLSSLSYAVDPGSPPARVGFSVALVLSIVTFNLVVSQDLPKINYATLLDWYVWVCFLFVVVALAEYAAVNNLVVSKRFGLNIPFLVDDFFMWTMPYTWLVFNICYWPLYNAVGLTVAIVTVWAGWMLLNAYRVHWNHLNNKRGLWAPTVACCRAAKKEWNKKPQLQRLRTWESDDEGEDGEGEFEAQNAVIQLAEATGQNVFEVNQAKAIMAVAAAQQAMSAKAAAGGAPTSTPTTAAAAPAASAKHATPPKAAASAAPRSAAASSSVPPHAAAVSAVAPTPVPVTSSSSAAAPAPTAAAPAVPAPAGHDAALDDASEEPNPFDGEINVFDDSTASLSRLAEPSQVSQSQERNLFEDETLPDLGLEHADPPSQQGQEQGQGDEESRYAYVPQNPPVLDEEEKDEEISLV